MHTACTAGCGMSATVQDALQDLSLTHKQLSALFSIVKHVHNEAIHKRLTIDRSFDCFKQVLLEHSIHRSPTLLTEPFATLCLKKLMCLRPEACCRPPYSVGLFVLPQAQALTQWFLGSYFMHYKLYQYAFTNRYIPRLLGLCKLLIGHMHLLCGLHQSAS